jgi:GT2 family glycosyltransferase
MADISVISVTYNSAEDIGGFYDSLARQAIDWELFVVDNASRDDTVARLEALAQADKRVQIIANSDNVGLAAANNQPIGRMRGEYVAIINPDLVLGDDALARLVEYLKRHRNVVAVGPVNVDQDGHPHSSFHRGWTLAHLFMWRIFPLRLTSIIYDRVRCYEEQKVLFVSGACLVTHRNVFEDIGGYDPEYFLTVEDVCDLCIRLSVKSGNKEVRVVPDARVTHFRSRSVVSAPFIGIWQGARGSIYHFRKHHGALAGWTAATILMAATLGRVAVNVLLSPLGPRYRTSARNQWRVLRNIVLENPIGLAAQSAKALRS